VAIPNLNDILLTKVIEQKQNAWTKKIPPFRGGILLSDYIVIKAISTRAIQ
jgi:hypothetical protein